MEYPYLPGGPELVRYGRSWAPGSTIDQIASTWPQGSTSLAERESEVVEKWILTQPVSFSTPTLGPVS